MGHSQQQTEKAAEGTSGTRCGRTEIPIIPRSAGIAANIHVYDVLHVYIYIYIHFMETDSQTGVRIVTCCKLHRNEITPLKGKGFESKRFLPGRIPFATGSHWFRHGFTQRLDFPLPFLG